MVLARVKTSKRSKDILLEILTNCLLTVSTKINHKKYIAI